MAEETKTDNAPEPAAKKKEQEAEKITIFSPHLIRSLITAGVFLVGVWLVIQMMKRRLGQ